VSGSREARDNELSETQWKTKAIAESRMTRSEGRAQIKKRIMKNLILSIVTLVLTSTIVFAQDCNTEGRPSITFIIGEDQSEDFFALAKEYYLNNATAQTDVYVDSCTSLLSVRNVLEQKGIENSRAWGEVNLVLHSNQWTGLSVPVTKDGERTSVESLFKSIQEGEFPSVSDEALDENTTMNFVSCGLGKNKDLLYSLRIAFGGFDDQQPIINSSEDFVYFSYDERQQVTTRNLKPFFAFYKTAYKPADFHLRTQLQNRYPNVPIDWLAAMQTKQADADTNVFHTKFNVPIIWNVPLDSSVEEVELETEFDKIEFIRSQKDLMETLDKFDIPIEKFRWQMKITEKAGKAHVQIKGKSTVLCVLAEA